MGNIAIHTVITLLIAVLWVSPVLYYLHHNNNTTIFSLPFASLCLQLFIFLFVTAFSHSSNIYFEKELLSLTGKMKGSKNPFATIFCHVDLREIWNELGFGQRDAKFKSRKNIYATISTSRPIYSKVQMLVSKCSL